MDIELYYKEVGNGIPFIMLHGNGENGSYFVHQIECFSKSYRVFAIDTRGHGKSPRGTAPFTIEQFADDLNYFFVVHGIEKAILLGFSDGANIAMKFAVKYPNKLLALILNGGNLNPLGIKRSVQIPIEIGYKIAKIFSNKFSNAKKNTEMLNLMVNEPNIDKQELGLVIVPTLVIAGTNDMVKTDHTKEIFHSLKRAELKLINGNHFIANKEYDEFNLAVDNFLKANKL